MLGIPSDAAPIVVACSGGSDSAAALSLMRTARPKAELIACYVDHCVRPRTAISADMRAVREQAASARAAFVSASLRISSVERHRGEAELRSARYGALVRIARRYGASYVVTGHQRHDLAETAVLGLIRGSGMDGIAAMRPRRRLAPGIQLVRPLLWASKRLLRRYVDMRGVPHAEDATNEDGRYRRNFVRRLLADLERSLPGSRKAIARSAVIVAEDASLLRAAARSVLERCSDDKGRLRADALRGLPAALVRHVLRSFVRSRCGAVRDFSYAQCGAIADALARRRGGTFPAGVATVLLSAGRVDVVRAARQGGGAEPLSIRAPRRSTKMRWGIGTIALRRIAASQAARARHAIRLSGELLPPGTALIVRRPEQGDRFRPSGRRTAAPLARFLAKQGLTRLERANVPLLCANGSIVAVVGVRASADFIAGPASEALELTWTPPNAVRPRASADV